MVGWRSSKTKPLPQEKMRILGILGGKSLKTDGRWPMIVDKRRNITNERVLYRSAIYRITTQESVMTFLLVSVLNVSSSRTFKTKIIQGERMPKLLN